MKILHKQKAFKVHWRKQNNILKIIVHQNTIDEILKLNDPQLNELISFEFVDEEDWEDIFNTEYERYLVIVKNSNFWIDILGKLPKVKLDGRIKKGEYDFGNFYLKIRLAERFADQVIELKIRKNETDKIK